MPPYDPLSPPTVLSAPLAGGRRPGGGRVWVLVAVAFALLAGGAAVAVVGAGLTAAPAPSSVVVVRPTPNVLVAVRELARLETMEFHMERVIDLTEPK